MAKKDSDDDWTPSSSHFDPFLYMNPHSKSADKTGVDEGKLIMENQHLAESLKRKQEYIYKNSGCTTAVEVTHFKNWGKTQTALLLHAKPTTRDEISKLVKVASAYNAEYKEEHIKVQS